MPEPILTLDTILQNACFNPGDRLVPGAPKDGLRRYRVETHCLAFEIQAKSNGDGTYTVISYETEDC